ncbi:MAG TPA: murein biosynthesis integral membrane protein MurJ [Acidimicrobiales bacterium]|nr:murein biosynthesis integral membrane protein MurJ [Acidimicrobiales bacterium]
MSPNDDKARPLHAQPAAVRAAEVLTVLPARSEVPLGLVPEVPPFLGLPRSETNEPSEAGAAAGDGPRSMSRNATIMAAGTALSRASGFARILAVAWVLGQHSLADAYNLANTVPNTIYDLLLGGVLSATLLPVLMEALSRRAADKDGETVPAVVSFLTVILLAATGIFWLGAPEIIRFFVVRASGSYVAGYRDLATTWLRYFTPQLFFIGLTTITTALLNARRRFAAVAFSPVLANLVTIAALVVADHLVRHPSVNAYRADSTAIAVVGIGTTAGYVVQLLAQVPALVRARIPLRPVWRPRHPALGKIGRLSSWTIGAVVANQVSFVLVSVLANSKIGNVSAFIYAYTFMQLPYAVVAVSIAYAVAPDLAELWAIGDRGGFASRVSYAMRVTLVLLVPGGVGYALLARPAMLLVLAHGHLAASSAGLTGSTLSIFALGLPGFSAYLLLMRAFQSKQDTRSMFWLYIGENALTVVAALTLYPSFGVRGLAAAWIGPYTLTLPFAWRRLRKSAPIVSSPSWLAYVAVSAGFMAAGVAALLQVVPTERSIALSALRLVLVMGAGAALFGLAARFLGISELKLLSNRYRALLR